MQIRKADLDNMDEILCLLEEVFAKEQQIPKELNPIADSKCPQWWCLEQKGKIEGTLALFKEKDGWHMGRIAISPALRGQHWGTVLLQFALQEAFAQDVDEIYLEARDATVHIMKKLGAKVIGATTVFYQDNITPIVLQKEAFLKHQNFVEKTV